jgi:hypothetical protein
VQVASAVRPESVTVGQPFLLIVTVRAPRGSTIEFPGEPDSGRTVDPLDPVSIATSADTAVTQQTATYRLAAWDIDAQPIALRGIVVRGPAGIQRVSAGQLSVFVRSVLPANRAEQVPKPARPLFVVGPPWWWPWLPILLAAALVAWFVWWWWRRRRRRMAVVQAFAAAEREFARIEAMALLDAGERGRYVVLVVEVVRAYLAARVGDARGSHTSAEVVHAVQGRATVPVERLATFLASADLIKFAQRPLTLENAREHGLEARAIVRDIEAALTPPSAKKAA